MCRIEATGLGSGIGPFTVKQRYHSATTGKPLALLSRAWNQPDVQPSTFLISKVYAWLIRGGSRCTLGRLRSCVNWDMTRSGCRTG
jgi:hypothetical protein